VTNGTIDSLTFTDPGLFVVGAKVPALGQAALLGLAAFLAGVALAGLRRRAR
jgi:hypothetical protein